MLSRARLGDEQEEEGGARVANVQKPAQTSSSKYVVVWKRQSDGSWQLQRDIWNENPAAEN